VLRSYSSFAVEVQIVSDSDEHARETSQNFSRTVENGRDCRYLIYGEVFTRYVLEQEIQRFLRA
jgi:hypothetical protein